jgi:plasmid stabilization system protein ParE
MLTRDVEIHPLAIDEVKSARRWYAKRGLFAAQRFEAEIRKVVQRISDNAELGVPYERHYRWMAARKFSYIVYYEIRDPLPY